MTLWTSFNRLLFSWLLAVYLPKYSRTVTGDIRANFNARLRLVEYLTNNSDTVKEILPTLDLNSPVELKIIVQLRQISTVDEKNQAIRVTVWLKFKWNNPFLTWDPNEYGGIDYVHVNNELFWVPDVALFNEASLEEEIEILYKRLATKLIISSDGNCSWNAPASLLSQCKIDVSRFPFDRQKCNITIGSWTYSGNKINISYLERQADMDKFIKNGEWEVESAILHNQLHFYGLEKVPYPDVTLTLDLQRRPLYYGLNIVIPCALIALLALFSFMLPSNHGERMSLVITVLLALSVYMLIVSSSLPETSDAVPILGIYCLGIIIMIALCLFATSLTVKFRDMACPMPEWLAFLVRNVGRFAFVSFGEENLSRTSCHSEISLSIKSDVTLEKFTNRRENVPQNGQPVDSSHVSTDEKLLKSFEESLLEEIRILADRIRAKEDKEAFEKKWKKAAKILDRFFLMTFFIVYVCLVAYLLSSL